MEKTKKEFVNLDALKINKKRTVLFLEKEFELSYIPCGLAIPLIEEHNAQTKKEIELKGKTQTQAEMMEVEIKMVSLFCSFYEPEFTEEYISKNATDKQLVAMYQQIILSIVENFGMPNAEDAETQNKKKQIGAK